MDVYILQIDDGDADPRGFYLIGPFDEYEAAGEWGASFAPNINWQVVDVDDPHQPMRVVAPSESL